MRQRFQLAERLYGSAKHQEGPKHEKFGLHLKAIISPAMMRQTDPIFGDEASTMKSGIRNHERKLLFGFRDIWSVIFLTNTIRPLGA